MAALSSRSLLSTTLWCCLLCYLLSHVPRAASLSFSFNFSDPSSTCTAHDADLACSGDAYLHSTENAIELTKNDISDLNYHSVGRVWHAQPVPLWDPTTGEVASFTTSFTFRIKPAGASSPELSADGMAFFLSARYPSGMQPGSYGRNLGLFTDGSNRNATGDDRVVAVEFDTYRNDEWEEDGNHVGIDVNSIVSAASTSPDMSIKSGEILAAEVAYDNRTGTLSVKLWMNGTESYSVKAKVDMRRSLPEVVAVGFSAATGANVEVHRLLTWSFNSTLASRDEAITSPGAAAPEAISSKKQGMAHGTIAVSAATVFVVVCALMVMGEVGVAPLQRRRRRRRRRREVIEVVGTGQRCWRQRGGAEADGARTRGRAVVRAPGQQQLVRATNRFDAQRKLGRGASGEVYRGDDNGRRVAVKKLMGSDAATDAKAQRRRREFEAEVDIISRLRHKNLVRLFGWCDSSNGLLLVYELISQGSLDNHLYGNETDKPLSWDDRYRIIIGLGKALCYLHAEHSGTKYVVHGDIKPSNIMLDEELNAKLGDFGLARLVDHSAAARTTKTVMGTEGYVEPEFLETGKRCVESDVYSFGIVLLEIVTGRRPRSEPPLRSQVWELYGQGRVVEAASAKLKSDSEANDLQMIQRVLVVGLWCTQPARSERPSISHAMRVLEHADAPLPALTPCHGRLTTLQSGISESQEQRRETSPLLGDLSHGPRPTQMYSYDTAGSAAIAGEQGYGYVVAAVTEASNRIDPSSSSTASNSTSYSTCSVGALATTSLGSS
ncbi:hypothetical protein HU200_013778 [Digitaria exilis]|uniref:non-specific serine/threonine protein kinase n=1 Tax=Digitaria exilis TaxID=1010633 RepID=A0A835KKT4_9POAL|nr:hypothetical protein HU200_013778 [Digitaria exilis]